MTARTDVEWVRQLRQENEQALQDLWELLYRMAIQLAWHLDCSEQDAEDSAAKANELLLTRGLAQFRFESKFSTFCHTIVAREIRKLCWRHAREISIEGTPNLEDSLIAAPSIPPTSHTTLRAHLHNCLQHLNQIEQQVINGIYLVGKTPQQVSAELTLTRNHVNVLAHRARLKLRKCLTSLGYHTASDAIGL